MTMIARPGGDMRKLRSSSGGATIAGAGAGVAAGLAAEGVARTGGAAAGVDLWTGVPLGVAAATTGTGVAFGASFTATSFVIARGDFIRRPEGRRLAEGRSAPWRNRLDCKIAARPRKPGWTGASWARGARRGASPRRGSCVLSWVRHFSLLEIKGPSLSPLFVAASSASLFCFSSRAIAASTWRLFGFGGRVQVLIRCALRIFEASAGRGRRWL